MSEDDLVISEDHIFAFEEEGITKSANILLVEDDHALLTGISELLEMSDHKVMTAEDGMAALELLEGLDEPPDLIVSDIRMPRMDGHDLLKAVRERPDWLTIPFIFLSAKGEKTDIYEGRLLGADDYVTKPFEFQELIVSIQACLKRRRQMATFQEARMEVLKRQILAVLNHEFRTPLSFIVAYADLMSNSPDFAHSDELRQYIDGIIDGSDRLQALIESFLILAELESGRGAKIYDIRHILINDLDGLVENIVKTLQPRADKQGVIIDLQIAENIPSILGDYTYLEHAIRHLIDNAIKFSPALQDEKVMVELAYDSENLTITVTDHGVGILPEELDRLFAPFYQINREKNEQPGTGSGLAIVKHVARLHEGRIEVNSVPDEGSVFKLSLPVVQKDGSDN